MPPHLTMLLSEPCSDFAVLFHQLLGVQFTAGGVSPERGENFHS